MKQAFLISLLAFCIQAQAQITGKWVSYDDGTNTKRCIVGVFERGGKYYGKVVKIFLRPGESNDDVCDKCDTDDERYNQKVLGLEILKDLNKDGSEYSGGTILDPENGYDYNCKVWREGEDLKVRGYLLFLYRTQTWKRPWSLPPA